MLYLKSLTLSRFKSFKHAELLFSQGFTCIVGPNASGKSNICDALLFALGETALRRMRVEKLELLINSFQKRSGELAKAYVRVGLDGDERIEITRGVRADGKSVYRLNGKRMTRHEVLETLKQHKMNVNETNTITQGETQKMMELSPKERRELIDIASGIKEFEVKKDEAMKELEKVDIKMGEVSTELNVRMGYLGELEKEKAVAEEYMKLSSRLKSLNYSVLATKERDVQSSYDSYSKDMSAIESKKQKLQSELDECNGEIDKLTATRQQLTRELTEHTSSSGEVSERLKMLDTELARLNAEIESNRKTATEKNASVKGIQSELAEIKGNVASGTKELSGLKERLTELEPKLVSKDAEGFSASETKMQGLNERIANLEKEHERESEQLSFLNADITSTKNSLAEIGSRLEKSMSQIRLQEKKSVEIVTESKELSKSILQKDQEIQKNESETAEIQSKIKDIDSGLLELKEQRAMAGARESGVAEKLRRVFDEGSGFYGKLSDLCSYDGAYSYAVEAAAGSRFEYLVVDSIDIASRMIEYLKNNELGRATFLPLKELSVERVSGREESASALIDLIKFEQKFKKAFEYVFNNTFIIEKIEDAKRLGVGKHRYVTLTGEIVEHAGVVSGGSLKRRLSLTSIANQIKELTKQREELFAESETLSKRLFQNRKDRSLQEMNLNAKKSEVSVLENAMEELKEELKRNKGTVKELSSKLVELNQHVAVSGTRNGKLAEELELARNEAMSMYKESIEATKSLATHGVSKAERERLERIRKEVEDLKVRSAQIQTQNQMFEKRTQELNSHLSDDKLGSEDAKRLTSEKETRKIAVEKEKNAVEEKIKSSSASSKKTYEKLVEMEGKLEKLNQNKGKQMSGMEGLDGKMVELNVKKSQAEVRLADLRAELAAYDKSIEAIKAGVEAMEREAQEISLKITQLGNVNMQAPETYEAKKREVDETTSKMGTLETEKQAVMKMIGEIDSKKFMIFNETFEAVNKNFGKLYNHIFPEKAEIELENPNDPFNSGLHVKITDGKVSKRELSLSGGQKSLVMLMLLFAIHMYRPASLYIFDEVDSALDKENSKKLSHLIKELSRNSQFIVVSHNDSLIVNADTAIGVAKSDNESRAVGLQISNLMNRS